MAVTRLIHPLAIYLRVALFAPSSICVLRSVGQSTSQGLVFFSLTVIQFTHLLSSLGNRCIHLYLCIHPPPAAATCYLSAHLCSPQVIIPTIRQTTRSYKAKPPTSSSHWPPCCFLFLILLFHLSFLLLFLRLLPSNPLSSFSSSSSPDRHTHHPQGSVWSCVGSFINNFISGAR